MREVLLLAPRLTYAGKSAGHELASPADSPTKFYRIVVSRQIQPTNSSTKTQNPVGQQALSLQY